MSNETATKPESAATHEDEIFKSLSHEIRRNIIKILGEKKQSSFTDIKNRLEGTDSPTLSYHLRSLNLLLDQNENQYLLTDLGQAALLLMDKIDQNQRIKRGKNYFLWSNIITVVCWTLLSTIVQNLTLRYLDIGMQITVIVLFIVFAQVNYFLIFRLWGKVYSSRSTPPN